MSAENAASVDVPPGPAQSGRYSSPPPVGLRQRPLRRAATLADMSVRFNEQRKGSFLSDVPSETKRSLLSSTDDFLLPRANPAEDEPLESSHWHSLPLGLALLPAIGGLFFKDGSSFITDITLLGLAALFLNWSVRLPWDWYHAAQEVVVQPETLPIISPIEEEEGDSEQGVGETDQSTSKDPVTKVQEKVNAEAARRELRTHESLALAACFIFPALGAWLLHRIRDQLSRPSEGLVSNYNLTIFLLASEVRPLSHLIKLVQRRTLFLQRSVSASALREQGNATESKVLDLSRRLDELEAHTADTITTASKSQHETSKPSEEFVAKIAAAANFEMRKQVQPELDALNRAMRRYEKRMTVSAVQFEARLQELETKVQDVVVLAAAAQRSADKHQNYVGTLMNWFSAVIVIPIQHFVKKKLGLDYSVTRQKDNKNTIRSTVSRQRSREKKIKPV